MLAEAERNSEWTVGEKDVTLYQALGPAAGAEAAAIP